MTVAPLGLHSDLTKSDSFERWKRRDLLFVAITLPVIFATMFSAMFFGLSNMN